MNKLLKTWLKHKTCKKRYGNKLTKQFLRTLTLLPEHDSLLVYQLR